MHLPAMLFLWLGAALPAPPVPPQAVAPARLRALSARYLGTPYRFDCLGEARPPDADPLFTRRAADCQTLVEQVMAEAVAPWVGGPDAAVRAIRYGGGPPALERRLHYCIPDWLEHPWPARDVTSEIGGPSARVVTRRIDLGRLLRGRGLPRPDAPRTVRQRYIPLAAAAGRLARLPDGSIVAFVSRRPDVVSGHLGFAFRERGTVLLRHASETRGRVIDEPLAAYVHRARRRWLGILVLQPDAAGLNRPAPR